MLFMLLFSRQGKLRLQKWYMAYPDKVKKKITRELVTTILIVVGVAHQEAVIGEL